MRLIRVRLRWFNFVKSSCVCICVCVYVCLMWTYELARKAAQPGAFRNACVCEDSVYVCVTLTCTLATPQAYNMYTVHTCRLAPGNDRWRRGSDGRAQVARFLWGFGHPRRCPQGPRDILQVRCCYPCTRTCVGCCYPCTRTCVRCCYPCTRTCVRCCYPCTRTCVRCCYPCTRTFVWI